MRYLLVGLFVTGSFAAVLGVLYWAADFDEVYWWIRAGVAFLVISAVFGFIAWSVDGNKSGILCGYRTVYVKGIATEQPVYCDKRVTP